MQLETEREKKYFSSRDSLGAYENSRLDEEEAALRARQTSRCYFLGGPESTPAARSPRVTVSGADTDSEQAKSVCWSLLRVRREEKYVSCYFQNAVR